MEIARALFRVAIQDKISLIAWFTAAGCAEASQFAEWTAADSKNLTNSVVACRLLTKIEIQDFSRLDQTSLKH